VTRPTSSFVVRCLLVAAIAGGLFLAWQLRTALLLGFGGVLVGVLLAGTATRLTGLPRLPYGWTFGITLVALAALIGGGGYVLERQVAPEVEELASQITAGLQRLPTDMQTVLETARSLAFPATRWMVNLLQGVAYALLLVAVAAYCAASPETYRRGLLMLFPASRRGRVEEFLSAAAGALWHWLLGTLASMLTVGVLTGAALMLLGLPAAVALGVIAAALEFIPILGPWLAAFPALLVAMANGGWTQALYVALIYIAIQQIEGNLIYPLFLRRSVALPPALTVLAVVAAGLLFGILGMFLATPLLVVALVAVNMLYIEDVLGERPRFPRSAAS
jgi:predicted PurR-regulated permease PerM